MDRGDLVPNEVVVDMVKNRLAQPDVEQHGWLLDGYPRSLEQAEAIEAVGIRPDVFLLVDVPDELLVERVVGRRLDPETGDIYHLTFKPPPAEIVDRLTQRSDDTEDKVCAGVWFWGGCLCGGAWGMCQGCIARLPMDMSPLRHTFAAHHNCTCNCTRNCTSCHTPCHTQCHTQCHTPYHTPHHVQPHPLSQVRNRLQTYHNNVDSVVGVYEEVLVRVDGTGSMEEVFDRLDTVLTNFVSQPKAAVA